MIYQDKVEIRFANKDQLYADLLKAREQQEALSAACAEVLGRQVKIYVQPVDA